ncbi:hypothetical protein AcidC75_29070 [Acidisoma sp. C75]
MAMAGASGAGAAAAVPAAAAGGASFAALEPLDVFAIAPPPDNLRSIAAPGPWDQPPMRAGRQRRYRARAMGPSFPPGPAAGQTAGGASQPMREKCPLCGSTEKRAITEPSAVA